MSDDKQPEQKSQSVGEQAKRYLDCVSDEKKQRMDALIKRLKDMPAGYGLRNPSSDQENQATEAALDACEAQPGAKFFVRQR